MRGPGRSSGLPPLAEWGVPHSGRFIVSSWPREAQLERTKRSRNQRLDSSIFHNQQTKGGHSGAGRTGILGPAWQFGLWVQRRSKFQEAPCPVLLGGEPWLLTSLRWVLCKHFSPVVFLTGGQSRGYLFLFY